MNAPRILVSAIGGGLILAAALKTLGLFGASAVASQGFFSAAWFQVSLVYVECLLGVWFLLAGHDRWKWLTAFGLFSVFAAINFHQGWEGRTSCGCFGPVQANPWLILGVDAAVLSLLLLFRPKSDASLFRWADLRNGLVFLAKPTLALGLFFGGVYLAFGSFDRAIALLRGQTYSLDTLVDFGEGKPGEHREAALTVTNWSRQPLRIVGGSASCTFVATRDLPVTIPAGETQSISMVVVFPPDAGRFTQRGELILDDDGLAYAHFKITGVASP